MKLAESPLPVPLLHRMEERGKTSAFLAHHSVKRLLALLSPLRPLGERVREMWQVLNCMDTAEQWAYAIGAL